MPICNTPMLYDCEVVSVTRCVKLKDLLKLVVHFESLPENDLPLTSSYNMQAIQWF